jgi:hypothetical protein
MLAKQPFSSIRELANAVSIRITMVHRDLTSSLGAVVNHVHWVLRSLRETQQAQRVTLSTMFLRTPCSMKDID